MSAFDQNHHDAIIDHLAKKMIKVVQNILVESWCAALVLGHCVGHLLRAAGIPSQQKQLKREVLPTVARDIRVEKT